MLSMDRPKIQKYYSELSAARANGGFERWIEFFVTGIRVSAEQATITSRQVMTVFQEDRSRLRELGRLAPTSLLIQEALQAKPLVTIATLTKATGRPELPGGAYISTCVT
jgi:Fic family protein